MGYVSTDEIIAEYEPAMKQLIIVQVTKDGETWTTVKDGFTNKVLTFQTVAEAQVYAQRQADEFGLRARIVERVMRWEQ